MITRISFALTSLGLGVGLVLGGCASPTDESDIDQTTADVTEQATPAAESPAQAAAPQPGQENVAKTQDELLLLPGAGLGMYGFGAYPIGAFGAYPYAAAAANAAATTAVIAASTPYVGYPFGLGLWGF